MRNIFPTVYYFCETKFKGAGFTWFYKTEGLRILEGDPRITDLYTKYYNIGYIYKVKYTTDSPKPYDIDWEKKQVKMMNYNTSKCIPGTHHYDIMLVKEGTNVLK